MCVCLCVYAYRALQVARQRYFDEFDALFCFMHVYVCVCVWMVYGWILPAYFARALPARCDKQIHLTAASFIARP